MDEMPPKKATSTATHNFSNSTFRLTEEDRDFLEALADRMGLSNTDVVRQALRVIARREGFDDVEDARKHLTKKGLR